MCPADATRREFSGLSFAALAVTPASARHWVEPLFRRIPSEDPDKRVALTLDACSGGFDERIARACVAHRARATIFLTARWIKSNKAGLAFLLDHRDLFTFQNHGARHVPPILGPGTMYGLAIAGTIGAVRTEVEDGARAILAATGAETTWYRGAAARYSPDAITEIKSLNHRIAAYSLSADQGASLSAAATAARMGKARDGDVIIGHINQPRRASGEGIAKEIAALRGAGFDFVDLDTLDPRDAVPG